MILADTAEPSALIKYIQQTVPVNVVSLNQNNIADYQFNAIDGHTVQVNRTQAGELLGDIDSFEDELRRYYNSADETWVIIEGLVTPTPLATLTDKQYYAIKGGKLTFGEIRYEPKSRIPPEALTVRHSFSSGSTPTHQDPPYNCMYAYHIEGVTDRRGETMHLITGGRMYRMSPKMYAAWLLQLDKAGITVFRTVDYLDTATALVAFYENMQKPEHTTLQRYIKPKIQIRNLNPHVQALINLSHAYKLDIGEVKATAIMEEFGDLFSVMIANGDDLGKVKGVGKKTIDGLFEKIGRDW